MKKKRFTEEQIAFALRQHEAESRIFQSWRSLKVVHEQGWEIRTLSNINKKDDGRND